jgi:hypothetical protein
MLRRIVFTPNAAKPSTTYSQAVKSGGFVFVSGTTPHDPATGAIVGTTIQEQVRQKTRVLLADPTTSRLAVRRLGARTRPRAGSRRLGSRPSRPTPLA